MGKFFFLVAAEADPSGTGCCQESLGCALHAGQSAKKIHANGLTATICVDDQRASSTLDQFLKGYGSPGGVTSSLRLPRSVLEPEFLDALRPTNGTTVLQEGFRKEFSSLVWHVFAYNGAIVVVADADLIRQCIVQLRTLCGQDGNENVVPLEPGGLIAFNAELQRVITRVQPETHPAARAAAVAQAATVSTA